MKLLYSDTSPYARKCRVLLRELDLLDRVEEIDSHPFQDGEDLLAANPLGRVPCLIMDDGRALTESTLIASYLNAQAETPWRDDWDERRLEALATGLLDLSVGRRVEMVRDAAIFSDYWIARRERGITRALDQLEAEAAGLSSVIGLGGLTIATAVSYQDFRYPECVWRDGRPALTAVYDAWNARESFQLTAPPEDT